ncbi:MAG: G8 domain-containing protein [Gemmataceae bacterium]|nr:G8 domain-containing protein [Gemmataceae bacterium]
MNVKSLLAALCLSCLTALVVSEQLAAQPAPGQAATVIRSARSGPWSQPATWEGGQVPGEGARVLIRTGHQVVYDVKSERVIRGITVAGTLRFATDRATRLDVGLIAIQPGETYTEEGFDCDAHIEPGDFSKPRPTLEVGSPEAPVSAGHTALIRLHYQAGMDKESCPAIVCCGGRMDFHGAPLNHTWVRLGATAKASDNEVTLAEPVQGWRVGDRVIVTATKRSYSRADGPFTEQRTITAIAPSPLPLSPRGERGRGEGAKLTLDQPLKHEHLGTGDYRGEVANLSRNVVVESADPALRGHTMYHRHSAGSISYSEFRQLGKKGVLGRYALHYHLCGDSMRGSYVIGASIWDSHNRWLTIHGTNYLVVRDCVGYKSVGHGFFLEDGTEVHNVLDHNLAVGARTGKPLPKQVLPFDRNDGAGYWWANSLNTFTRNVAADCDRYGFRYEATPSSRLKLEFRIQQPDGEFRRLDIRTLPFVRFDDNEVHSSVGLYGVNLGEGVNRVGPDAKRPFVVRNLKIWDVHYGFRPQVPSLLVENLHIHKVAYGIYHPNYDNHFYRNVLISQTNTEPFNRGHDDLSVQYGVLAVDGLTFDNCRSGGMPLIQISDDNPTGAGVTHFRNVKTTNWKDGSRAKALVNLGGGPRPKPKTDKGVPIYLHDWFGPGRHALVVSSRSPEFKAEPGKYRAEAPLTGDESRVAEVDKVTFPAPPAVVDDLPPTTVITHVQRKGTKLLVRGTTADNGEVSKVTVNGRPARSVRPSYAEWEVEVEAAAELRAHSEDAAGNIERRPHVRRLK